LERWQAAVVGDDGYVREWLLCFRDNDRTNWNPQDEHPRFWQVLPAFECAVPTRKGGKCRRRARVGDGHATCYQHRDAVLRATSGRLL
jgi:hypothetical protein